MAAALGMFSPGQRGTGGMAAATAVVSKARSVPVYQAPTAPAPAGRWVIGHSSVPRDPKGQPLKAPTCGLWGDLQSPHDCWRNSCNNSNSWYVGWTCPACWLLSSQSAAPKLRVPLCASMDKRCYLAGSWAINVCMHYRLHHGLTQLCGPAIFEASSVK